MPFPEKDLDIPRVFDESLKALLAANPSLQHAEGLGALCSVLCAVLRREESAFLAAQRPVAEMVRLKDPGMMIGKWIYVDVYIYIFIFMFDVI